MYWAVVIVFFVLGTYVSVLIRALRVNFTRLSCQMSIIRNERLEISRTRFCAPHTHTHTHTPLWCCPHTLVPLVAHNDTPTHNNNTPHTQWHLWQQ